MASIQEQLETVLSSIKQLETIVTKLSEEQKRKDEDLVSARYQFHWRKMQPSIEVVYNNGTKDYIPTEKATKGQTELAEKELAKELAPVIYKLV